MKERVIWKVDEPIRIAVVGLGMRGAWGVEAIKGCSDFSLAALVDPVPARSEMLAREFALTNLPRFRDLSSCLRSCEYDAVALFAPDGTHAELALPALAAGKWVFVEKPLEITENKLQMVIDADIAAGGRTFVGFNLRYAPMYTTVQNLIQNGAVGQLLTIQADEFYDGGRTYFRRWNRLRRFGGGLWITKACHDFDLLYWMAQSKPKSVFATSSLDYYKPRPQAAMYCRECPLAKECPDQYERLLPAEHLWHRLNQATEQATGVKPDLCVYNSDKDTFDHGVAAVTFENGILASYTVNVVTGFTNRRLRISGTRATIDGDLASSSVTITHRDPSRQETVRVSGDDTNHGGADDQIFPSFARFIRGQPTTYVSPAEAAVAVRLGLAATQSCDLQALVMLD